MRNPKEHLSLDSNVAKFQNLSGQISTGLVEFSPTNLILHRGLLACTAQSTRFLGRKLLVRVPMAIWQLQWDLSSAFTKSSQIAYIIARPLSHFVLKAVELSVRILIHTDSFGDCFRAGRPRINQRPCHTWDRKKQNSLGVERKCNDRLAHTSITVGLLAFGKLFQRCSTKWKSHWNGYCNKEVHNIYALSTHLSSYDWKFFNYDAKPQACNHSLFWKYLGKIYWCALFLMRLQYPATFITSGHTAWKNIWYYNTSNAHVFKAFSKNLPWNG